MSSSIPFDRKAAAMMTTTEPRWDDLDVTLVLTSVAEPGDGVLGQLVKIVGRDVVAEFLFTKNAPLLARQEGMDPAALDNAVARWSQRIPSRDDLDRMRARMEQLEIWFTTPGDESWPEQLDDLGDHAPLQLFGIGDPRALNRKQHSRYVAVVGARAASSYGVHVTGQLVSGLVQRGCIIVSGGAYGIDEQAHRAALAEEGDSIAVLAGGVDRLYPAGNQDLLRRVAAHANSAVISELPPFTAPMKWRFLQRNRIIAALAAGTIVVEAGVRSGSLNTATHAVALRRLLTAVPGAITSVTSEGTRKLLREFGAVAIGSADEYAETLNQIDISREDFEAFLDDQLATGQISLRQYRLQLDRFNATKEA